MPHSCNIENHCLFLAAYLLKGALDRHEVREVPEEMASVLREYPVASLKEWQKQIAASIPSKSSADLLSVWFEVRDSYIWRMVENEWEKRFPHAEFPCWSYVQECGGYEECVKKLIASA